MCRIHEGQWRGRVKPTIDKGSKLFELGLFSCDTAGARPSTLIQYCNAPNNQHHPPSFSQTRGASVCRSNISLRKILYFQVTDYNMCCILEQQQVTRGYPPPHTSSLTHSSCLESLRGESKLITSIPPGPLLILPTSNGNALTPTLPSALLVLIYLAWIAFFFLPTVCLGGVINLCLALALLTLV